MTVYAYFWVSFPDSAFMFLAKNTFLGIIGYHHLWYIAGLIGAAVIFLMVHRLGTAFLIVSAILSFIIGVAIQYLGNYNVLDGTKLDKLFNEVWAHRNAVFLSYPFFCMGYLIHKYKIYEHISFKLAGFLVLTGVMLLLGESYFNYLVQPQNDGLDNLIALAILCPAIFLFFYKWDIKRQSKNIASYATAIYLSHILVLYLVQKLFDVNSVVLTISVIIGSFAVSFMLIKINQKVKYLL